MNHDKLHKYLDDGAVFTINAVGVTFKSSSYPQINRQTNIIEMKEGVEAEDREIELRADTNNKFDDYALEIMYEGYDTGFIPKNNDIHIKTAEGKGRRAYVKGINKMLLEYPNKLEVEVEGIYGGYKGRHLGFSVSVSKA